MKRFRGNEEGSVLVMGALLTPILLGFAAFAVDLANLYYNRAQIQRAADAAALGAVLVLPDTTKVTSQALALVRQNVPSDFGTLSTDQDVIVGVWDPDAKSFTASAVNPNAVQVKTHRTFANGNPVQTFFGGFVGASQLQTSGSAIAVRYGGACVRVLDDSASAAFEVGGNGKFAINCGLQINSSASNAARRTGSAQINTAYSCINGGYNTSSGWEPAPKTGCPKLADPLASTVAPDPPSSDCSLPASSGTMLGNCKIRGNIRLNGDVTLQSGTYYLQNARVTLGSNARINGTGVTIFIDKDSTLDLGGGAEVRLSAQTSGPQAGIVIFQAGNTPNTTVLKLNGNGDLQLEGIIYAPSVTIEMGGNSSLGMKVGYVIANKLKLGGSSELTFNAFMSSGAKPRTLRVHAGLVR